jgi:hypothetical protein
MNIVGSVKEIFCCQALVVFSSLVVSLSCALCSLFNFIVQLLTELALNFLVQTTAASALNQCVLDSYRIVIDK